jgi:hypothetical protein
MACFNGFLFPSLAVVIFDPENGTFYRANFRGNLGLVV